MPRVTVWHGKEEVSGKARNRVNRPKLTQNRVLVGIQKRSWRVDRRVMLRYEKTSSERPKNRETNVDSGLRFHWGKVLKLGAWITHQGSKDINNGHNKLYITESLTF